jgi:hypothetical protein
MKHKKITILIILLKNFNSSTLPPPSDTGLVPSSTIFDLYKSQNKCGISENKKK